MTLPVFQPGVNVHGVTLTFEVDHEPQQSRQRGNHDWQSEMTVADCVPLIGVANLSVQGRGGGGLSGQIPAYQAGGAVLMVPRDAGVTADMRFWFQGQWWGTRGDARYDIDHVLTGENFGYVEWTIVKGG